MGASSTSNLDRMTGRARQIEQTARIISMPFQEIFSGIRAGVLPVASCLLVGCVFLICVRFGIDRKVFRLAHIGLIYPSKAWFRGGYLAIGGMSGFLGWGIEKAGLHQRFIREIRSAMDTSGLKNRLGNLPRLIGDWAVDATTRKMRLTNACLPRSDFVRAKEGLEAALKVYIDDLREDRERGTLDIIYSKTPMPAQVPWDADWIKSRDIVIGQTRSNLVKTHFHDVPHLLVAGQTGGGKSTFLRQVIASQFLADASNQFILIDLKGGLEFQMFQDLPRVVVAPDLSAAMKELHRFESILSARMSILKNSKCKDRVAYMEKCRAQEVEPDRDIASRFVIVIDEAAEMFLAGTHASASEIQKARVIVSQIARQGRAVGVHLIIATQRPDTKALDPQVKANLTGVLCFQMANDASSVVVLGCGRATDLPAVPGRAIWKTGSGLTEVQVPHMSANEADDLLASSRIVRDPGTPTEQPKMGTIAV